MPKVVRLRVANPRRKTTKFSKRRNKRRGRNPLLGGGELALMTNPKRKNRTRRRRSSTRRSNPFGFSKRTTRSRRRRSNPFGFSKRRSYSRRRRNPAIAGYGTVDLVKIGISAAAGGYGTRALTQMLLQANNTGWMGYGANAAVALALGWAANKFLGKDYGVGVIAGGISATAIRIWSEQVSQTSPSQLSGLGDLDFSSTGMGDYVETAYPVPTVSQKNAAGQYIIQAPPYPALPAAVPTAATAKSGKGMGRMSVGRFKTRWAS